MTKAAETTKTTKKKTGVRYRRSAVYVKELSTYIEALADPQREAECLELYFVQGYNYEQISQTLHINVSTICRNIHRGEEKMNRVLNFARELLGDQAA